MGALLALALQTRETPMRMRSKRTGGSSGLTAKARIAVGHETGALFVAGLYMSDIAVGEAAVQVQGMHTGNTEDGVYVVTLQQ